MKDRKNLSIEEVLGRRSVLYGRRLEHVSGSCDVANGRIAKSEIWSGILILLRLSEYSCGTLLSIKICGACRVVALATGAHGSEHCESCEFSIVPSDFAIYEWSDGDISFQAGQDGLGDMFVIRAPRYLIG